MATKLTSIQESNLGPLEGQAGILPLGYRAWTKAQSGNFLKSETYLGQSLMKLQEPLFQSCGFPDDVNSEIQDIS